MESAQLKIMCAPPRESINDGDFDEIMEYPLDLEQISQDSRAKDHGELNVHPVEQLIGHRLDLSSWE